MGHSDCQWEASSIAKTVVLKPDVSSYIRYVVALLKISMLTADHAAHCSGPHDRTYLDGFNIGRCGTNPAAHCRIYRYVHIANQDLSRTRLRNFGLA
jgi:hypothetical protein